MSQFPRHLRNGDNAVMHHRGVNRSHRRWTTAIHTQLLQEKEAASVTLRLPLMEVTLDPSEGINLHAFLPVDERFHDGLIRVETTSECEGVHRPSGTAHLDRLEITGRRPRSFSGDVRQFHAIEAVKLAALYIGAMEYADLAHLLDDWDDLVESSTPQLEHRCKLDALALDRAVRERASLVAGGPRTAAGGELMSCYARDPDAFAVGYARRDVPFMLQWHMRRWNRIAPLIRANGIAFKSETEWMKDHRGLA